MQEFESFASPLEIVPTRAGYDLWAQVYDDEENPLVLLEEDHIAPLILGAAGLAVADIGCGTGRHALRLARAGARVTGLDFSKAMLDRARKKPGADQITFVQHDLAKPLPLENAAFDMVLCCLVLDHIAELDSFYAELGRICRQGGAVIISVMHPAMNLRGVQARFTDPASGLKIGPQSHPHTLSEYIMAALRTGLQPDHMSEHAVDASLALRCPRAARYVDWPMLFLLRLRR